MNHHSKIEGNQFEGILEKAARYQNIHFVRIPDGCKTRGYNQLMRVPTPCDYILIHNGISVFIDCKSYDSDRICYSDITEHQAKSLHAIERAGCVAGLLIWLRKESCVAFVKASQLSELQPKDHIHGKDMIYLSSLSKEQLSIEEFYLARLFSIQLEEKPLVLTGGLN